MKRSVLRFAIVAALCVGTAHAQTTSAHVDTVARVGYSAADVRFMREMMGHHSQALVMTALVPTRSARADVRTLAQRIEQSQQAEIAQMTHWLARRGETVPAGSSAMAAMPMPAAMPVMPVMPLMPLMPGMLTEAQLAELAGASGGAFDRLFLRFMIAHHEGALTMVAGLLATPGAAQESEIDRLSSDVDADQRAEIARMRALLGALPHE